MKKTKFELIVLEYTFKSQISSCNKDVAANENMANIYWHYIWSYEVQTSMLLSPLYQGKDVEEMVFNSRHSSEKTRGAKITEAQKVSWGPWDTSWTQQRNQILSMVLFFASLKFSGKITSITLLNLFYFWCWGLNSRFYTCQACTRPQCVPSPHY